MTKARAAAQLFTYNQEEVRTKFGLKNALFENTNPETVKKEISLDVKTKQSTSAGTKTKRSEKKSSSKIISQVRLCRCSLMYN